MLTKELHIKEIDRLESTCTSSSLSSLHDDSPQPPFPASSSLSGSFSDKDQESSTDIEAGQPKDDDLLSSWAAACILINFISVGYILNPSGTILSFV